MVPQKLSAEDAATAAACSDATRNGGKKYGSGSSIREGKAGGIAGLQASDQVTLPVMPLLLVLLNVS